MTPSRRNLGSWLRYNWLELLLVVILLLAIAWIARTALALRPPVSSELVASTPDDDQPGPSPTLPGGVYEPTRVVTPSLTTFDGQRAQGFVASLTALGPRPSGTEANPRAAELIAEELRRQGWEVVEQDFEQDGVALRNVIARTGSGDVVLLGTHYDTLAISDLDSDPTKQGTATPGANDGASGVAVLLELAQSLDKSRLINQVWLAFFDGKYLNGEVSGGEQPASAGARYLAENLDVQPQSMILIDLVGGADQQFFFDGNSDPRLSNMLWQMAEALGFARWFVPEVRHEMVNDHLAFRDLGVPVAAIADLDYPFWRSTDDTADKLSSDALERTGRVLEEYLEQLNP